MYDVWAQGFDSAGWPVSCLMEFDFGTESEAITWAKKYFCKGSGGWDYIAIKDSEGETFAFVNKDSSAEYPD